MWSSISDYKDGINQHMQVSQNKDRNKIKCQK